MSSPIPTPVQKWGGRNWQEVVKKKKRIREMKSRQKPNKFIIDLRPADQRWISHVACLIFFFLGQITFRFKWVRLLHLLSVLIKSEIFLDVAQFLWAKTTATVLNQNGDDINGACIERELDVSPVSVLNAQLKLKLTWWAHCIKGTNCETGVRKELRRTPQCTASIYEIQLWFAIPLLHFPSD